MGISVLMSVYRKEKAEYLIEALNSMLNQTLKPDEIVLVKDGPLTEELENAISDCKQRYGKLVTYQFTENVQLGLALAKGVELCRNELVARMDTDDIAVPERLELQSRFMVQNPQIAVCGGWMKEFNDDHTYGRIKKMPESEPEINHYAKYRNPLNHMTVMFRRSRVLACGNYHHFPFLEDYELWNRMLAGKEVFYNLPRVLVKARTNQEIYKRRGGISYFKQYRRLRGMQRELGIVSDREYLIGTIMSFLMTMQPGFLRKLAYRKFLRASV